MENLCSIATLSREGHRARQAKLQGVAIRYRTKVRVLDAGQPDRAIRDTRQLSTKPSALPTRAQRRALLLRAAHAGADVLYACRIGSYEDVVQRRIKGQPWSKPTRRPLTDLTCMAARWRPDGVTKAASLR